MNPEKMKEIVEKTINMPKWAVVGASDDPDRYSFKIIRMLKDRGYTVYPVSPNIDKIQGLTCYDTLSDIPEKPEVVDMVVNPRIGKGVMKEIADLGIEYVWLQPGTESEEIHSFAKKNGIEAIEACVLATLSIRKDHRVGE